MTSGHRLTGHERLYGSRAAPGDAMILDFWRWAFSNLQMGSVRNVFAEWMVAKLLGLRLNVRDIWSECDLVAPNGVRIEVMAEAYLRARPQDGPLSQIVFSGLQKPKWSGQAQQDAFGGGVSRADLYVFCVQTEKDPERWDALDLAQWRFYTVTGPEIEQLGQQRLSLETLRKLCAGMRAGAFRVVAGQLINALGKPYNARV